MADGNPMLARTRTTDTPSADGALPRAARGITTEEFREGFGEELTATLNIDRWRSGRHLDEEYRRIEAEVQAAVQRETEFQHHVREEIHPRLAWGEGAPKGAGRHAATLDEIAAVHRGLLFPGAVEACDGTSHVHDTLPLTIHQIGVSLVSYRGDQGTWCQRLFRHDLRRRHGDPTAEALELLERRGRRGGLNHAAAGDPLSELAKRAIMSYAERAVLLHRSQAVWRMGHGSPAPLELLTGGGSPDLMIESVRIIRELVQGHQKFVYVASEAGDRGLLTIGHALRPLEYAIVCTLADRLEGFLANMRFHVPAAVDARWDGTALSPEAWLRRFRDEVAPQVVVGLYRATLLAPAQVFYAHVDHADIAARIALADSVLQEQRGFPLLIDLADGVCRSVYGATLREMAEAAYASAGVPFLYLSERATRQWERWP